MNARHEQLRAIRAVGLGAYRTKGRRALVSLLEAVGMLAAASCHGGGGSSPSQPAGQPPAITSFAASRSWITTGQSVTLTWSISSATSVTISPIGVVGGTSADTAPTADTTYVLTASNQYGSSTAQASVAVFAPPTAWFAPLGATTVIPVQGATDYFDLFKPAAAWPVAASHITVFKMYAQMLNLDDATLRNMFADLKRRHIAFALEWGPLDEPNRCGIGEGFSGNEALLVAQRIRDLGGSLQYIAFDEPFDGAAFYDGPGACHWTPLQTAQNGAKNVAVVQSVFPDVVVGDIEVLGWENGDWLSRYEQWLDAWAAVTGKPLAFFHFDMDWGAPNWRKDAAALTRALVARHIPVGQIYNGNSESSDAAWVARAEQRAIEYETRFRLVPEQTIFQSWQAYPKHLLPETDPTSFTYLIDRYERERTTVSLSSIGTTAHGTLAAGARAVAGAEVTLTAMPLSGTGQTTAYVLSGALPNNTRYVVFVARVGIENCADVHLPAELYLTDFTLDVGVAGQVHADFASQSPGWQPIGGNPSIAQIEPGGLHVQVMPGETMSIDSFPLPVAASATTFTFTLHAKIPPGSLGRGCAIAVFQDASFQELDRAVIHVDLTPIALGSAQTAADGSFLLAFAPQTAPYELWASYAGSDALWPAAAAVSNGGAPPLTITTSSLPDGAVGSVYRVQLLASGGPPPFLWASGEPPPGLLLTQDGVLSGTPSKAGIYEVSTSVVDDRVRVADATFQLVVR